MSAPDSGRYLSVADAMLRGAGSFGASAVTDGWWPKACACLIRLALEAGINQYWQRTNPAVAQHGSGRIKLLMLRHRVPREVVREATYAWAALSRATHHHCYDASSSVAELRRLYQLTETVTATIAGGRSSAAPTAGAER
jgi:hypothetical protein